MNTKIIKGLVLVCGIAGLSSCGGETTSEVANSLSTKTNGVLKVGMELAYPPFETKDENGDPTGVSPDLAQAFADEYDAELEIENIAWDGLIPSLQTNKVDVVISSMSINEERAQVVNFSDSYAHSTLSLFVRTDGKIKTEDDLDQDGLVGAVRLGNIGYYYLEENYTNIALTKLDNVASCVTEVMQGKADFFIYDPLTCFDNQELNEGSSVISLTKYESQPWGAAFNKENPELLAQFNTFLAKFIAEDGFAAITDKYLSDEKAEFEAAGIEWFFDEAE